jgi:hypothetical protein
MIVRATARKRPVPRSAARKPRTSSGSVFAMRWAKPKCMKAAGITSTSSLCLRGTMPKVSSELPVAWSTASSSHSSSVQRMISLAAGPAVRRGDLSLLVLLMPEPDPYAIEPPPESQ